jgi:YggT family protein
MDSISSYLVMFLSILLYLMLIAIFARALLSWFPVSPDSPLVRMLHEVTEPVLAPLRRVVPRIGMIDLSTMVAIVVIYALLQGLNGA